MNNPGTKRVRFGCGFEVDLAAGRLRRNGVRIRLPEQSFQVLAVLLKGAGDIVSREQLKQTLWPAATYGDFDHGVDKAVNRLRQALCDSAANPRYVETLRGRGYRFLASTTSSDMRDTCQIRRQLRFMVFPFAELGPGSTDGFAEALTEELSVRIGQAHPEMVVVAARGNLSGRNRHGRRLCQIAAELNLSHWLEGSVRRFGDRVRITARLIEASGQTQLWADSYERLLKDVFAVQSETARIISQLVVFRLLPQQSRRGYSDQLHQPVSVMEAGASRRAALRPI